METVITSTDVVEEAKGIRIPVAVGNEHYEELKQDMAECREHIAEAYTRVYIVTGEKRCANS